jgi:hypothetical protein
LTGNIDNVGYPDREKVVAARGAAITEDFLTE